MRTEQKPPARTLSAKEMEGLKGEIKSGQALLDQQEQLEKEGIGLEGLSTDKQKARARIKELEKVLEDHAPERETDPVKRDRIAKRRKELEDKFIDALETVEELRATKNRDPIVYQQALDKAAKRPLYDKYILDWRELGKRLEPNDPTINDLTRLRKYK